MNDMEIQRCFRQLKTVNPPEHLGKLIKGLRSWYKKTGGLSEKQQHLLQDITTQFNIN